MNEPDNRAKLPLGLQAGRLPTLMQFWFDAVRLCERTLGPFADLAIRLALAQAFFVSGVLKVANWDNALLLAENEYPVTWLSPSAAAVLGAAIEVGGAILLAAGLGTRLAAGAMLVLTIVIQVEYRALDTHLFWAALFLWYLVRGAGPLSLDHLVARGLASSPLPFVPALQSLAARMTASGSPLLLLLLRLWLAAAIAFGPWADTSTLLAWVPLHSAAPLPQSAALLVGALLAIGLVTRLGAAALLLALFAQTMMAISGADAMYRAAVLGLVTLHGGGRWSLDALIHAALRRYFPQLDGKPAFSLEGLPRVVIVGAGFGGLACATALRAAPVRITLIDRHNYHLFQPLLYQVATASLSASDIAVPVRGLLREQFNAEVMYGEVTGVDTQRREVLVGARRFAYDYLVLATGATHGYFGRDDWAPLAPGLKRVEDATEVRRRLLTAFERAEATTDPLERRSLLNFLIVGGGPTGVELAGAIAELTRFGMDKDFRHFDPAQARVILVQAAPRLLPAFPEALSGEARRALEALGVEVLLGSRVEQIDGDGVTVNGQRIPTRTVLWAAGVVASPAARWLGAACDNSGRVKVESDLSVPAMPDVFAIGDTALSTGWAGQAVPGLAPAAKQGGLYVARSIRRRVQGKSAPPPFRYRHLGSLATIGRKAAVADFGRIRLRGAVAWWLWGLVHVGFLAGVRNRVSVMLDWGWAYLTFRSGTRLITGAPAAAPVSRDAAPPVIKAAA